MPVATERLWPGQIRSLGITKWLDGSGLDERRGAQEQISFSLQSTRRCGEGEGGLEVLHTGAVEVFLGHVHMGQRAQAAGASLC